MDKVGCDMICKNHSARSERDQFRICPTKLSKQELEDLYFALVEDNLELKKTINGQQDRIKVLSTKLQRMTTTQKIFKPGRRRDCCVNTEAVVNQQKEIIADLKHVNERMADRIRKLNMTLCSAKQFSKSVTPKCLTCSSATSPYLIKNAIINKYTQTEAFESTKFVKELCQDNKCITIMDELKHKIKSLQEELSHTKEEYSARINSLQVELEESRNENVRVRSERVVIEQEMIQKEQKTAMIVTNLRAAEGLSNELKTQLSIEHRKVAELKTRLKAATMSNRVTDSIENTLTSIQESVKSKSLDVIVSPSPRSILDSSVQTCTELTSKTMNVIDETRLSKSTDDSGYIGDKYTDKSMDDESLNKIIEELTKRILVLQTQVDSLTISPPESEKVNDKTIANELSPKFIIKEDTITNNLESIDTTKQRVEEKHNSNNSNIEMKPNSPKKEQNHSLKVPIENFTVSKIVKTNKNNKSGDDFKENNEVKNKDRKKDNVSNEKIDKRNENLKDISKDCDIERNVENKSNSATSDEKTYTIPNKDENVNNNEFRLKIDNTENNVRDYEKKLLKSKTIVEKPLAKGKNKKIIKPQTVLRPELNVHAETAQRFLPPCREATYTLNNDNSSTTSTDDTDYEISSMTDLSEDKESKRNEYLLSPGERKYTTRQSESVNITTDTTNYSLSEGEIPTTTVRRRSKENNSRVHNGSKQPVVEMEETLHAISDEIARCKRLLFSQRSRDSGMSALM